MFFDTSCKENSTETSLNSCLHVGPSLSPLIFDTLRRFRVVNVAIVGDISKVSLNIEVDEADRDCLRFLWVKDTTSPDPEIDVYRFNRVVFGANSSPFLLNALHIIFLSFGKQIQHSLISFHNHFMQMI